jgi:hypothetical protein
MLWYTEKTGGLLPPPATNSKPAWETFSRPNRWVQGSQCIPSSTPEVNQHSRLGRLTPPQKKTWINNKVKTNTQQRGWVLWKNTREGVRGKKLISPQTSVNKWLERQEGWWRVGDKPLPEIGQVLVYRAHLLSQWATFKVQQYWKTEKQSANLHNMLTERGQLTDHWQYPRERGWGKETSPQ